MKTLTITELREKFLSQKGAAPITVTLESDAKLKVKDNPLAGKKVLKRQKINCFLGANYTNSVNRQLGREGKEEDFVPEQRKWGTRVMSGQKYTPLIAHNGGEYVELKVEKVLDTEYTMNGVNVDSALLTPFLPAKSPSNSQGTDKRVVVITPKLENIREVNIGGEKFTIKN